MFKCSICKKDSKPGERAEHVVTETRVKHYTDDYGKTVGVGSEIVTEVLAFAKCKRASELVA